MIQLLSSAVLWRNRTSTVVQRQQHKWTDDYTVMSDVHTHNFAYSLTIQHMVQLAGNSIYNFSICKSHNIKSITSFLWLQQIQSLLCYFNSLLKQKRAQNHIVTSATGIHVTSLVGWSRVTPHSTQYRSFRRRYMSLAKTNQIKNYFICCPCLALFSDTDTILRGYFNVRSKAGGSQWQMHVLYSGWNDIMGSMITMGSPFCG